MKYPASPHAFRASVSLLALEPRMLFDGACFASFDLPGDSPPLAPLEQPPGRADATDGVPPVFVGGDDPATVYAGQSLQFLLPPGEPGSPGLTSVIGIVDPDNSAVPPGDYKLVIASYHGRVTIPDGVGEAFENGTTHVTVWGSLDELNTVLGGLTFAADENYRGDTVIRLQVTERDGAGDAQEVAIHVVSDNQAPEANDDLRVLGEARGSIAGNVLTGAGPGDQADTDPDGDALTVGGLAVGDPLELAEGGVGQPLEGRFGTLTMAADGSYQYVTNAAASALAPGEQAQDVFSYLVCDGEATDRAQLRFDLAGAPDDGSNGGPVDPPVVTPPGQPELPVPPPPGPTAVLPPGGPDLPGERGPVANDPTTRFEPMAVLAPYSLVKSHDDLSPLVGADPFSGFTPAAVLGRIETDKEKIRKPSPEKVPVTDDGAPPVKPGVVKRSALTDGQGAKEPAKAFSAQLDQAKQRLKAPVRAAPVRANGR
ncbi:MAG: Ig-like domain-containing protein [Burkholderiaceae bacterium]